MKKAKVSITTNGLAQGELVTVLEINTQGIVHFAKVLLTNGRTLWIMLEDLEIFEDVE